MPQDLVLHDDTDRDFRMRFINADTFEIYIRYKGNAVIEQYSLAEAGKIREWLQEFIWEAND